ncbi:MAG: PIN domain-containing protein [Anaerolineae bacterium]|nr:PIN domain-containing protein [Anaerolineae bacterium]MCB0206135.1 PIN domain-containing protein [Anaerolineae bacterium]MCB0255030.1 PIN domain-containing protein [Anaerolineae bacterium]
MAVIDTSVYVTLINPNETAHEAAWAWYVNAIREGEPLVAPAIILPEVAAALSRGVDDRDLAHRAADRLLRSRTVELVPVSLALAQQAAAIAADHRIRGCDAIFVALAQYRADVLITLDRQQLERGSAVVTVRSPG